MRLVISNIENSFNSHLEECIYCWCLSSLLNTNILKNSPNYAVNSIVGPESGGAESIRDVRGWAMKIKTSKGDQDFVFNN
jgi:catalase